MPDIRISELPTSPSGEGTDLFATTKGSRDVKLTLAQLANYILNLDDLAGQELLNRIVPVADNNNNNGLNAQFLQGFTPDVFLNASLLTQGTVADTRLPNGDYDEQFQAGGAYSNAGTFKAEFAIPAFIAGGNRILIQYGWSTFVQDASTQTVTFKRPFASGFSNENKPWVLVSPECRRDNWNGAVAGNPPFINVELDAKVWYSDLNSFRWSTLREAGSQSDTVRVNWIAIGKY